MIYVVDGDQSKILDRLSTRRGKGKWQSSFVFAVKD